MSFHYKMSNEGGEFDSFTLISTAADVAAEGGGGLKDKLRLGKEWIQTKQAGKFYVEPITQTLTLTIDTTRTLSV